MDINTPHRLDPPPGCLESDVVRRTWSLDDGVLAEVAYDPFAVDDDMAHAAAAALARTLRGSYRERVVAQRWRIRLSKTS